MTPTRSAVSSGPAPGRAVVTRASRGGRACSVEDAIADMDALGYDFHLYTDSSGEDCLLQRVDGGHILTGAHGRPPWRAGDPAVLVRDDRAPWLTAEQAMARLDLSARRFLFYVDDTDRRARLLYQRADGGYGVVVPAEVWRRPHRR